MLSCNGIKAGDPGAMADYYEGLAPEDFQWQQRPSSSHSATDPNGGSNLKPAAQTACGCMSLEGREHLLAGLRSSHSRPSHGEGRLKARLLPARDPLANGLNDRAAELAGIYNSSESFKLSRYCSGQP